MAPSVKVPPRALIWFGRQMKQKKVATFASGISKYAGVGNGKPLTALSLGDLVKMTMNNWKIISQFKELLTKYYNDRNVHIVLNKEWTDFFHKMSYSQIETFRKYYTVDSFKSESNAQNAENPAEKKNDEIEVLKKENVSQRVPKQDVRAETIKTVSVRDQMYNLSQVISALIPKLTSKARVLPLSPTPKWKSNIQSSVSKQSIISRTRHILNSIQTAESNSSKLKRIEDLIQHLHQYNDTRHHAIRNGAISILLNTRRKSKNDDVQGTVKEALALLGYIDPLPGRGIRILSIDGGGIRGIIVIEMLKRLEQLTGKKVHEMFDYICGVSTGAILSGIFGGSKKHSLDEISELYKELSTKVFTQNSLRGTSNLVWSHAYYDTALWQQLLQEHLGDTDLIKTIRAPNSPRFSAVSAVINHSTVMAYVFRNYTFPHGMESQYTGCHKHKLWEIARASAAAPTYFEEYKCGEFVHQDGGIMVNNPTAVAIHEAKQLWPDSPIQCIVSCGTGRAPFNLNSVSDEVNKEIAAASSWKDKFFKIIDSATDTEAVHTTLNDLLPDDVYFRFNPYLTEMLSMVEIRPEKWLQLEQDAHMYMRRNDEKIRMAAKALTQKRKVTQKINDWVQMQKQLHFP